MQDTVHNQGIIRLDKITFKDKLTWIYRLLCGFIKLHGLKGLKLFSKPDLDALRSKDSGSKNHASAAHIRKGIVGDFRNYVDQETLDGQWKRWVETNVEKYPNCLRFCGMDYFYGDGCSSVNDKKERPLLQHNITNS